MKRISILGSTGSIGRQALEVAQWRNYEVCGLAAGKNTKLLLEQVQLFKPQLVSCDERVADAIRPHLPHGTKLATGQAGNEAVARLDVDTVLAAIPGIAGLKPTVAALEAGRHLALANKEAMVVAGPLIWNLARKTGSTITPVDSEHSALFQCLLGENLESVSSLILTASGGPFRLSPKDLSTVSPEQALKHPNWNMGNKVTIDSASLFNKGLEVLEAHFLFELALKQIEVVIHPQSLVHSLVRFQDGNLKAQIGPHDMRVPIHYALAYPERLAVPLSPLPLEGTWEFHPPDLERFPSLKLAYQAGEMAGCAPAALNAADEIAVSAFLKGKISFMGIPQILEGILHELENKKLSWQSIEDTDQWARNRAQELTQT